MLFKFCRDAWHIQLPVETSNTVEQILTWAGGFRSGELTVEDVQERFATLDITGENFALPFRKRVTEAKRELDAIRFGMCESGQRAEIARIFVDLERIVADLGPEICNRKLNRD